MCKFLIETKDLLGLCYSLLNKNLAETYLELVLYVYKKKFVRKEKPLLNCLVEIISSLFTS